MDKIKVFSIFLTLCLVLFSCNFFGIHPDYGVLKIDFSLESDNRTINSSFSESMISQIRMEYSSATSTDFSAVYNSINNINVTLRLGNWSVEVYALDDSGNEIAYAESNFIITSQEYTDVSITLSPLNTNADGTVTIVTSWEDAADGINQEIQEGRISAFFYSVGADPVDVSGDLFCDFNDRSVLYENASCTSGNYRFEILFFNSEDCLIASAAEAVNVRDYLPSSGNIELTDDDFNLTGVNISIGIDVPEDEIIYFNYDNDQIFTTTQVAEGISIAVDTGNSYESYIWSMYGYSLSSTSETVVLPETLTIGVYHLTVYVESNGLLYSGTMRFTVTD